MAEVYLDPRQLESYRTFLKVKRLPSWNIRGRVASFPDEYAEAIGVQVERGGFVNWDPSEFLFDYQRDLLRLALQKRKYAIFADCGLGKTLIFLEYMQSVRETVKRKNRGVLMVSPLMVVEQTIEEAER